MWDREREWGVVGERQLKSILCDRGRPYTLVDYSSQALHVVTTVGMKLNSRFIF